MRRDDILLGIGCVLSAVLVFATANLAVKWLGSIYPVIEMMFYRNVGAVAAAGGIAVRAGGLAALRTRRPFGHLRRSCAGFASIWCSFQAIQLLPLAEATALSFSSPLFVAILSAPVLGERVGALRWLVVAAGFGGVLALAQPGQSAALDLGAGLAVASGFLYALAILQMRELTRSEHPAAIAFYYGSMSVVLSGLLLPVVGHVWPSPRDATVLLGTGAAGGVAQTLVAKAYSHAPAAVVAPFIYGSIIWSALYGWLFFDEWPNLLGWGGILMVMGSGLLLGWHETRAQRAARRAAQGAPAPAPQAAAPAAAPER